MGFLDVVLHNAESQVSRLYAIEGSMPQKSSVGTEIPVSNSSGRVILEGQNPIVINDVENEKDFVDLMASARSHGAWSMCLLQLTPPRRLQGALVFGTTYRHDSNAEDLELISTVAKHLGVPLENSQNFDEARSCHQLPAREREWPRTVFDVNNNVISHLELGDLFQAVSAALRRFFA